MPQSSEGFLFASLNSRQPLTTRAVHIRRLYDLMQLCIHRQDLARATRAWTILARCKEVSWMTMWSTGLLLLAADAGEGRRSPKQLEYLRTMMLRYPADVSTIHDHVVRFSIHPVQRQRIFRELILHLILSGRYKEAADEAELCVQ